MGWLDVEDRLNRAVLARLGETVLIDGQAYQGDYCSPSTMVSVGEFGAVAQVPQIVMPSADVPSQPVGRLAAARGTTYRIADARPDGRGMTVLLLENL